MRTVSRLNQGLARTSAWLVPRRAVLGRVPFLLQRGAVEGRDNRDGIDPIGARGRASVVVECVVGLLGEFGQIARSGNQAAILASIQACDFVRTLLGRSTDFGQHGLPFCQRNPLVR